MMNRPFLPFALPDITEAVGATHGVALNSCTAALHLALEALGIQAGDEVLPT